MSEESTTPDLVELTRQLIKPTNERDLDRLMYFYAPDAVWEMGPMGMGTFRGGAAVRGFIADWFASYEEYEFEVEEVLDLGNGVSFSVLRQQGRPVGSSGEVELRYAAVGVWEGEKIKRLTNYTDIEEARVDAEDLAEERA
jgi:ketosteroid isomerase-like protein